MNMQPEHENFEDLRRILVLKRYEQPPPGYFNDFSRKIIARIEAGQGEVYVSVFEQWLARAPWVLRIFQTFERKPILAGAFGMVVCGLVVSGVVYSENTQSIDDPLAKIISTTQTATLTAPSQGPSLPSVPDSTGLAGQTSFSSSASTAGAAIPERLSLFEQARLQPGGTAIPANFNLTLTPSH
jgi:hypothetical protein